MLHQRFGTRIAIEGANYPPTALNAMLSRLLSFAFFGGLILMFFGTSMLPQQYAQVISNNKMMVYGGLFLCNQLASALVQTGAFEVSINGKQAYSKLETGALPEVGDLINTIETALRGAA